MGSRVSTHAYKHTYISTRRLSHKYLRISFRRLAAHQCTRRLGFDLGAACAFLPPQRTNQIFTPRETVVRMVDLFEQENPGCFDDPTHTFADLYMKSGLYITEIIKRLFRSEAMKAAFPSDRERLNHILEHQVFGIAPTEIIYQIATHYILGYNNEVGTGCKTNFVKADSAELAKQGKLASFVEEAFGAKLQG